MTGAHGRAGMFLRRARSPSATVVRRVGQRQENINASCYAVEMFERKRSMSLREQTDRVKPLTKPARAKSGV